MPIAVSSSQIVADFAEAARLAGIPIEVADIEVQEFPAPHRPPSSLPPGKLAVYVFMMAGSDSCLKVGKVGRKSGARYCSQHYGANRAPSTLARSLIKSKGQFASSAYPLDESNISRWICENTDRISFLISSELKDGKDGVATLSLLEAFIQCRLKPKFEGFESPHLLPNKTLLPSENHRTATTQALKELFSAGGIDKDGNCVDEMMPGLCKGPLWVEDAVPTPKGLRAALVEKR